MKNGPDVSVAVGKRDCVGIFTGDFRCVVGHQHPRVSGFLVRTRRLDHVNVAFIRKRFFEGQLPASDIPEMDVEYLVPLAEPANHVKDFFSRVFKHFRNRTLAEVQAVHRTCVHLHEPLHAIDRAQHPADTAVTIGRVRVVRMAGKFHPVLFSDRDNPFEEVVDPLPVLVGRDVTPDPGTLVPVDLVPLETRSHGTASTGPGTGAGYTDDEQPILDRRNSRFGTGPDDVQANLDFAVSVGRYAECDVGRKVFFRLRANRQGDHVDLNAVRLDFFPVRAQYVGGPLFGASRRISVDVVHAKLGEHFVIGVVANRVLGSDKHIFWHLPEWLIFRRRGGLPALHDRMRAVGNSGAKFTGLPGRLGTTWSGGAQKNTATGHRVQVCDAPGAPAISFHMSHPESARSEAVRLTRRYYCFVAISRPMSVKSESAVMVRFSVDCNIRIGSNRSHGKAMR